MKVLIPASSFLLALIAFYLKNLQWSIDTKLTKLFSIDAVNQQLRLEIISISHQIFFLVICITIISIVIAAISIYNKLCNKIMGTTVLLISILSFLCSLIRI